MTDIEKQLIHSSYLGDAYWMRQKIKLRIKFGGYVKNYIEWKHSLITTLQKSKVWGSVNRKNILYEFTTGNSSELDALKEASYTDIKSILGELDELGFAIIMFDNGTFDRNHNYYYLCIVKYYSKKFANNLNNALNKKFELNGSLRKAPKVTNYNIQYKVKDTPIIASMLLKYSSHDYSYKIPSSETIAKLASRYKVVSKDLGSRNSSS